MRISENRYIRDLRRINLARRMINLEVRTESICRFTGLGGEAIRNLVRSYRGEAGNVLRHRGPSPRRLSGFLRSPAVHNEASALAGMATVLQVIPDATGNEAEKRLHTIEAGERLCHVYEVFSHVVVRPRVSMNQFIVLAEGLAEGREVLLGQCKECPAALLQERVLLTPVLCAWCKKHIPRAAQEPVNSEHTTTVVDTGVDGQEFQQQILLELDPM